MDALPRDLFDPAARVLAEGVASGIAPAVVAEVGSADAVLWSGAFGRLEPDEEAPRTTAETIFDLASLTKPIAAVTIAMRLVGEGRLSTADRVQHWLPAWRGTDRAAVTVGDLLAHCSGLTSHLPLYRECRGRAEYEAAICSLPLEYVPGTAAVYSDLGFILLGFLLETCAGRGLDAQFDDIRTAWTLGEMTYLPPAAWMHRTAPTGLDRWRGRVLRGEVHDRNAHALGGVAAHAGLFGTAAAVGNFARVLLRLTSAAGAEDQPPVGAAVARRFVTKSAVPSSSRALGWDTMRPSSSCGPRMHPAAIGHTGYTGTSLWLDYVNGYYFVLLTNRVHPNDANQDILRLRPRFHDAVIAALPGKSPGTAAADEGTE
jgi:CubicO group peptidase (beta-lactamase class C family)